MISLGNAIIGGGKYSYESKYFDNFRSGNDNSKEAIFRYDNTAGVGANNSGIGARWNMTLHYNSYTPRTQMQAGTGSLPSVTSMRLLIQPLLLLLTDPVIPYLIQGSGVVIS